MSDERIDAIVLAIGRRSLRLTRPQIQALDLLAYLSKTLRLATESESTCEYAPAWIQVEIDGGRFVDVEDDGGTSLLPPHDERMTP